MNLSSLLSSGAVETPWEHSVMEDDSAKLAEELNTDSSKWLKTKGSRLQSCHWQNGHGGFSVSAS